MTGAACDRESAVLRALHGALWTDELRDHVAECESCSDLVAVTGFLRDTAAAVDDDPVLPDPGYIWWRAQLAARAADAERATRGIVICQRIAVVFGGLLALFGISRVLPLLKGWLPTFDLSAIVSSLPGDMAPPVLVIVASVVVLAAMIAYDRYEPRTER
jgi:hypothetical protein